MTKNNPETLDELVALLEDAAEASGIAKKKDTITIEQTGPVVTVTDTNSKVYKFVTGEYVNLMNKQLMQLQSENVTMAKKLVRLEGIVARLQSKIK